MSQAYRLSVSQISEELGIHMVALNNLLKAWLMQEEVLPASGNEPNEIKRLLKELQTTEKALSQSAALSLPQTILRPLVEKSRTIDVDR